MSRHHTLRMVAREMRLDHGPEHERHDMWEALAGLLEEAAETVELYGTPGQPGSMSWRAVQVAEEYLEARRATSVSPPGGQS